jgi:RND family efflux transporter MFP subunit
MRRTTGFVIAGVLIVGMSAWVALQFRAHRDVARAASDLGTPAPLEVSALDVATVNKRSLSHSLPMSGTLMPFTQATIKSKVSGEVLELSVREGQDVKKGDVLVRIDTRNLQVNYDSQAAALEKARADLDLAKLNRDKNRALLDKNYISKTTYEATESAYAANVANVKLAQAMAKLAEINLQDAVVRAPFAATVAKRFVFRGEKVAPDSSLLTLVDLLSMELQAAVPASEVSSIKVGQRAKFEVSGFGNREFMGLIERINPVAEEGTRSITVYLNVQNKDGALRGGMFAQGALTLEGTELVLAIPITAIHQESGARYVYTLQQDTVVRTPVTLGLEAPDAGLVEVKNGLSAGDRFLATQIDRVQPGVRVVVKGSES